MPTDHRSPITGSALRRIHAGVAERNSIERLIVIHLYLYLITFSVMVDCCPPQNVRLDRPKPMAYLRSPPSRCVVSVTLLLYLPPQYVSAVCVPCMCPLHVSSVAVVIGLTRRQCVCLGWGGSVVTY